MQGSLHRENGKWPKKNPCQGKHREFGNLAKTQGIWFAQVVNFLILKVKDILIFAVKISNFFWSWISLPSRQFCVCNSQKSCKLAQGKFAIGQGKNNENTGNLKMKIWVGTLKIPPPKATISQSNVSAECLDLEQVYLTIGQVKFRRDLSKGQAV